jgi:8-oxo-dGTP diphosphatase
MTIQYKLYTMCVIQYGERILLLNRPEERGGSPGFRAPGGKVEFPESIVEGAMREVWEETGLRVSNLIYKGLDEYVNPKANVRYMVFNYITQTFEGELLENPPEGALEWVSIKELDHFPMPEWFRRRLPLFFDEGTFEIQAVWDEDLDQEVQCTIRKT